ncbi:hypothetical protein G9X67_16500 [Rhizobium sp. WYCCWR 11152]|uniref:restriction endonuclease subunit S n=1 Tax=Rhizobium sp. WYCCWR 11152 TaxID=2692316 RepID=UPI001491C308|nr:restriction endonuclease subunit S [Rhizobium sp. WYCCWR 11152]NNU66872.1 hypothetical protein [Rhizobium sp. WYCCWR 11152]
MNAVMRPQVIGFRNSTVFQWPLVKMQDVCTLNYGRALTAGDRRNGHVPVYGSNGRTGWHDTPLSIGPTVILGRKGQGNLGVEWCEGPFWVIDTAYYATFKPHVSPRYFYYFVNFVGLNHLKDGTSNPSLSRDVFAVQPLPLPPLDEQRAIETALAAFDNKIELNRRMNETLEAMAQAIFRDWFVDFGPTRRKLEGATDPVTIMGGLVQDAEQAQSFADLFPATLDDYGLPEGWLYKSIYSVAKVIYGAPYASKQFNSEGRGRPLARIRDLPRHEGGVFTEEVHPKEYLIAPGDIAVGMDGEFRAYLWQGDQTLMNQRICCFSPVESDNRAFLYLGIKPLLATHETTAIGTTVIHLGKKEIDGFTLPFGGNRVLEKFSHIADPLIAKLVANGQQNSTLAATRDLLLPKLMSGEIRLSEAEDLMEAAQ